MDIMVQGDNKYGNWASMGEEVKTDTGHEWSNTVGTFDEDAFRAGLIDGALDLFPMSNAPKPKPKPNPSSSKKDTKSGIGGKYNKEKKETKNEVIDGTVVASQYKDKYEQMKQSGMI